MPLGGGRKLSTEWEEVDSIENYKKVMCKHWITIIRKTIQRVRLHLIKCPKYANSIQMLDDEDI